VGARPVQGWRPDGRLGVGDPAPQPATFNQLEKAIAKAKSDRDKQPAALPEDQRAAAATAATANPSDLNENSEPDVEQLDDEDLIEHDER
jgi:hypothetical protein